MRFILKNEELGKPFGKYITQLENNKLPAGNK